MHAHTDISTQTHSCTHRHTYAHAQPRSTDSMSSLCHLVFRDRLGRRLSHEQGELLFLRTRTRFQTSLPDSSQLPAALWENPGLWHFRHLHFYAHTHMLTHLIDIIKNIKKIKCLDHFWELEFSLLALASSPTYLLANYLVNFQSGLVYSSTLSRAWHIAQWPWTMFLPQPPRNWDSRRSPLYLSSV